MIYFMPSGLSVEGRSRRLTPFVRWPFVSHSFYMAFIHVKSSLGFEPVTPGTVAKHGNSVLLELE